MSSSVQDGFGGQTSEFITPLGVSYCAERLAGRNEKRTFFAWDGQSRLKVDVTPVEDSAYRFRMRRVDKNSVLAFGSLVEVRGTLRGLGTQTAVRVETHWSWLWTVLIVALFVGMGVAFGFMFNADRPIDDRALILVSLLGLLGLLVGALYTWWWGGRHLRGMLKALKDATEYVGE